MADTRHHLSLLHANRPSVFEVVAQSALVPAPEWLNAAMLAFAGERDLMSRLMLAAGPPPNRLGQTSVQETVSATRTALLTIGRAHVYTPVTNAHLVCRRLLVKKNQSPPQRPAQFHSMTSQLHRTHNHLLQHHITTLSNTHHNTPIKY